MTLRSTMMHAGADEAKRNASEGFQGLPKWLEFHTVLQMYCQMPCYMPAGYCLWINGLFAWHRCQPEMSLQFLQTVTKWFSSQENALANVAFTLCRAVRYRGASDRTTTTKVCALELLEPCQATPISTSNWYWISWSLRCLKKNWRGEVWPNV